MAWVNPKVDWVTNPKKPRLEDFNRIEGNIAFLQTDIETKKGLIVTAVNNKRVTASTTNTFAEIAAIIDTINLNYRKAEGASLFTQVSSDTIKLQITDLPFKPSRVFADGAFSVYIGSAWFNFSYALVDTIIRPGSLSMSGMGSVAVTATRSFQDDGFTVQIYTNTGTGIQPGASNHNWYCYE